ncbi:MAG: hypothetical protein ACFFDS_08240, partial [Candidatus Thorarchaeota archaeon]
RKSKQLTVIFILLTLFTSIVVNLESIAQEGVYYSPTSFFELNNEKNFTVYSTAPLTWTLNSAVNFSVYLNATGLPSGENITIEVITVYFDSPDYTYKKQKYAFTPMTNLTETQRELEQRTILYAPDDVNKYFNISLVILAHCTNVTNNQVYEADFPGDVEYIEVKKNIALPIINLPGFPDADTFLRWIFIFGVAFVLISMPSIFVVSFKIKEIVESRKTKGGKK